MRPVRYWLSPKMTLTQHPLLLCAMKPTVLALQAHMLDH